MSKREVASPSQVVVKKQKLCELGTGEVMHVVHYRARVDRLEDFECVVQAMAHSLYGMQLGITDVRVCHPQCGEVCFVVTFLSKDDCDLFVAGPLAEAEEKLKGLIVDDRALFSTSGCLMPSAYTLCELVSYLKKTVVGHSHHEHNVRAISKELGKWFPRPAEYAKYIHWDKENSKKYTRNLVYNNEYMDVILMCWPAQSQSSIHDHDESSCWVVVVEGCVHEKLFALPQLDRKFIETEMQNPTGAVGRCGKLRLISDNILEPGGITNTYANNDLGVHRVENHTNEPAYTLHVYAPPLKKMKIFSESGNVSVHVAAAFEPYSSIGGIAAGSLDVEAWNTHRYTSPRRDALPNPFFKEMQASHNHK
jgi:hypothetical protein